MNKRIRALVLAIAFTLSSIVPMRSANAIVPLAVGLVVSAIGPAGTVAVADLLTAGVTAVIGGVIVALAITPTTADAPVRVPLVSDKPTIDAAMPPPTAPLTGPVSGGSVPDGMCQPCSSCNGNFGPAITCAACYKWTGGAAWNSCRENTTGIVKTGEDIANAGPVSCGQGYTLSNGACVLVNPRVAVPDTKYDVERTPSGYQGGATTEADSVPPYASIGAGSGGSASGLGSAGSSPGKVIVAGRNSSGQPVMIEYAVSADGTRTYITHYTQSESAGQTIVNKQAITVDAATGQVTGVNASASQGSISGAGAGSIPAVDTGANSEPIVFPTDYARTGEAASAANTIKSAIDAQSDISSASLADPVVPSDQELRDVLFKDTFTPLLSWSIPGHSSVCPTADLSFTMFGHYTPLTLDAHCTIFNMPNVKGVLSVVMQVVWSVVALFILLGA